MRLSSIFAIAGTFVLAAILAWVAAGFSVTVIEDNSRTEVRRALELQGMEWAEVDADGLQVFLAGTAPTEATRFGALSVAGGVVDAARVIDQMLVEDSADIAPPRFSVEILRNGSGLSLIGLIPTATDRDALLRQITDAAKTDDVADLLETADYPMPEGWEAAIDYSVRALSKLDRAKISIDAGQVTIETMTDSIEEKLELETELSRRIPARLIVDVEVSAPRPVITPFTLRFLIEEGVARFDACSADTEASSEEIIGAATKAGLTGEADCVIGLGVPTPQWGRAGALAISAVAKLGGGSVTFADADISLIAAQGTPENTFDDVVGELDAALPDVFALHAVLPPPPDDSAPVTPEFVATLSPEGSVQLRGRLGSDRLRQTVDSFAKARFTTDSVYTKARVVEGLPPEWPVRVLTGLEALAYLSNGAVVVEPEMLRVVGNTGHKTASAQIAGLLAEKLGEAEQFEIDVTYQEKLDPVASIPTPEECIALIAEQQVGRKLNFEPGSSTIDSNGADIVNDIAEILENCGEIQIEIGGYTDSQGREAMNQQLSQARANAVLDALRARRILTSSYSAVGHGEANPIADNDTEEGREANRRIEFRLIVPETTEETETGLEALEDAGQEETDADEDPADDPAAEEGTADEQN
ncbi:OmpA family protein [Pseudohalocynthiibacter aestuariivivens]|nr:OmpA family protein [Pseudohalocynthiibacter aestuariivivens]QIE45792.1 OmpA family protein [Pseudohalocynthiibacter aestuariivivens]